MQREYYVLPDIATAESFLATYINGNGLFPVKGYIAGQPAPEDHQKTTEWHPAPDATVPMQLIDSETGINDTDVVVRGAIPRIPSSLLDFHNVPQANRDGVLAVLTSMGGAILTLDTDEDFPQPEES